MSLPTWKDNVGYEEGDERVLSKMITGYPRFFIHKEISGFAEEIVEKYGTAGEMAMLFPSKSTSRRCAKFIFSTDPTIPVDQIRTIDLVLDRSKVTLNVLLKLAPKISAVVYPKHIFPIAKQYWQHSGDGVSSRRGAFCRVLFREGALVDEESLRPTSNGADGFHTPGKGPKRYQRGSIDKTTSKANSNGTSPVDQHHPAHPNDSAEALESSQFLEERFGRNLDVSFVDSAKSAIRRRIAGSLMGEWDLGSPHPPAPSNGRGVVDLKEEDVYLYPCGMNSIFQAHQMMLQARGQLKSISFGFPYVDTLKILQKWGPGAVFYGNGSAKELDDLEARLKAGEKFLALFCEFPGNPMLTCPDLKRIRKLADTHDFGVVVDETIGNFINVHVLPYADIVVSSLTKIFSGECNVMGGSMIINPQSRYYQILKKVAEDQFEDNYWAEDVIFMERNSRHFVSRIDRINENADLICNILLKHPLVKNVYYPKHNTSRQYYEACRSPNGGYGGLLSLAFHKKSQAIAFYDRIETAKGPSLGTNFTLVSPYVVLAHFTELDWAAQFGVPADLLRISVGLEDAEDLKSRFTVALKEAEEVGSEELGS